MIDLSGNWTLRDTQGSHEARMQIPGDAVSALLAANVISDPYWGKNEYDCRWIADLDWTVSRSFDYSADGRKQELDVSGLDCFAEIRLNGELVLSASNAFRTFHVDVTDILKSGANDIEILFKSNTVEAKRRQDAQPYPIPYLEFNCDIPDGNMLRKVQCDFGWDWNIALAPFGLIGDISIRPATVRIDQIAVKQTHSDGTVELDVTVSLRGETADQDYSLEIAGQVVVGKSSGEDINVHITIADPEIWWPVGLGEQPLYDLKVTVADQVETRKIGLRVIEVLHDDDDIGTSFMFVVNGHKTYARGANWIPQDALASNITYEATRDLLQSAVDANMNMIRIWGGGRYEADWFYDLCSEMGLMIWQDFMFACNVYPADKEFLDDVEVEVREQVKRLSHHACIALWCGDNELIGTIGWFEITRKHRDRYLVGYDRLNRTVEMALKDVLPDANWWASSPSSGPMNFGDAWHDDSSGDMHFWDVWHENKDFSEYRKVNPRFCSEFGFQSFPSMNIIRSFTDDPEDMNLSSPVMESHQKNKGGNERIGGTIFRYFRFPTDFENFVYLSQVQQGLAIKTAVEYWRSIKPHCMGALYWQLNDTWPVASWSSLDYGGDWKLMHHMAKQFFEPVTVNVYPKDDGYQVVGINDRRDPVEVEVTLTTVDMDGKSTALTTFKSTLGVDAAVTLGTIDLADVRSDQVLVFNWTTSNGEVGGNHITPVPYKELLLQNPEVTADITADGDIVRIKLSANKLALFVSLEAAGKGRFDKNCILMTPDASAEIIFTPADGNAEAAAKTITIRDLWSSSH